MHNRFASRLVLAAAFCASLGGSITPAFADPLAPSPQTCTTLNCGALVIPGRINSHPTEPALANSWVGQFAGKASNCLRFHVTAESRDLAMTVVASNGTTFTNNNGGVAACTACPLVVVASPTAGFYTAVISSKGGTAAESTFSLKVGLYNSGNSPNCASPTTGK